MKFIIRSGTQVDVDKKQPCRENNSSVVDVTNQQPLPSVIGFHALDVREQGLSYTYEEAA